MAAERAFLRSLGGDCATPIAAHARLDGDGVRLTGLVASTDGATILRGTSSGPGDRADEVGSALAAQLRARGADDVLASLRTAKR